MLRAGARHLRSNAIAYVALFISLTSGSYAAATKLLPRNSVGTKQVVNHSLQKIDLSKRAVASLKGARGARGPTGASGQKGATGAAGRKGATGAQGSPTEGAVMGRATYDAVTTAYASPFGTASANLEQDAEVEAPAVSMVATALYVRLSASPGGTESRSVTLRVNETDTALTCSTVGPVTGCASLDIVSIPVGARLSMKLTRTGSSASAIVRWGFVMRRA